MPVDLSHQTPRSCGGYDLLRKVADGGMASVFEGRHRETGRAVAVKVVNLPAYVRDRDVLLLRFAQEFRAASSLDHPNIVRALDFGWEGETPFLVMELVEGETLGDRIQHQGRLAEREAVAVMVQVAEALAEIHRRGMVHRDVKPDNVLLACGGVARLTDLGLVKDLDTRADLTRAGGGLGTPNFMAPEQYRDAKNADARCDLYGLGATLYMAVTGALPFAGCNPLDAWVRKLGGDLPAPRALVPELSERVDRAIRRAMSAEPADRPASCREFINDLTGGTTETHPDLACGSRESFPDLETGSLPPDPAPPLRRMGAPTQARFAPPTPVGDDGFALLELPEPEAAPDRPAAAPEGEGNGMGWLAIALGIVTAAVASALYFLPR